MSRVPKLYEYVNKSFKYGGQFNSGTILAKAAIFLFRFERLSWSKIIASDSVYDCQSGQSYFDQYILISTKFEYTPFSRSKADLRKKKEINFD